MANNSMGTKKVEELLVSKSMPLGMQFYVPNYQRGYRWKESQVQQLLNDIKEFDYEKNNEKKFYCLQPLVVTEDILIRKLTKIRLEIFCCYSMLFQCRIIQIQILVFRLTHIRSKNGIYKLETSVKNSEQ